MARDYPATGGLSGISDRSAEGFAKKTLWTKMMCERGSNLCVGLYWAVQHWSQGDWEDFWLALNRIASHSCECHFGTTRSSVRGDPRADTFQAAEVTAVLIDEIMRSLGIKPFLRRFRETAGCTLVPWAQNLVSVDFGQIADAMLELFRFMKEKSLRGDPARVLAAWNPVIGPFLVLHRSLGVDPTANVKKGGPMAGQAIHTRFFTLPRFEHGGPSPDQRKVLDELADE